MLFFLVISDCYQQDSADGCTTNLPIQLNRSIEWVSLGYRSAKKQDKRQGKGEGGNVRYACSKKPKWLFHLTTTVGLVLILQDYTSLSWTDSRCRAEFDRAASSNRKKVFKVKVRVKALLSQDPALRVGLMMTVRADL